MNRSWVLVIGAFALVGCVHQAPSNLPGKYVSKDDFGVFVFRGDGSFGYKFPVKFDSYSEDNLPPNQGHYRVLGTQVVLSDLSLTEPKFSLKLRDGGKSFLLIREERNGTLPEKALYRTE